MFVVFCVHVYRATSIPDLRLLDSTYRRVCTRWHAQVRSVTVTFAGTVAVPRNVEKYSDVVSQAVFAADRSTTFICIYRPPWIAPKVGKCNKQRTRNIERKYTFGGRERHGVRDAVRREENEKYRERNEKHRGTVRVIQ